MDDFEKNASVGMSEFSAPGTSVGGAESPEELSGEVDEFGSRAPSSTPFTPETTSAVGREYEVQDYLAGLAGGFNLGITDVIGAPVDLTNFIIKQGGLGSKNPLGGSNWIRQQMEGLLGPTPTGPDTPVGRVVHRVGRELGTAFVPAAGIAKVASKLPVAGVSTGGMVTKGILEPVAKAPALSAAGEVSAATGAGVGAGMSREIAPDNTAAEVTSQILGGIAGPTALVGATHTAGPMVAKTTKRLLSSFSTKAQNRAAERQLKKVLGGQLPEKAVAGLEEAEDLAKIAPGFDPSTAGATKSAALRQQQEGLERRAFGEELDSMVAKRASSEAAIEDFRGRQFEGVENDPELIVYEAADRVDVYLKSADKLIAKNLLDQGGLVRAKNPTLDKFSRGEWLRKEIDTARTNASLKMSIRLKELGLDDVDISEPFDAWQSEMVKKYGRGSRYQDVESIPGTIKRMSELRQNRRVIETLDDAGEPTTVSVADNVSFNDLKAIRERIVSETLKALSPFSPDKVKVRGLTLLKRDLDMFLKDIEPTLGEGYSTFRREYYENFVVPFERGAVYRIRRKDGTGDYRTSGEQVAQEFLRSQSTAKQFQENFGGDLSMQKAVLDSALDDMFDRATLNGVLDERKLESWVRKNDSVLNELPWLKNEVTSIETAQNNLWERQAALAQRRDFIGKKTLAKHLARFQEGALDEENVLGKALQTSKYMGELVSFLKKGKKGTSALESLQKNTWLKITDGTSEQILQDIDKYRKSLYILFDPAHVRAMERVSAMKGMMEFTAPPKGAERKARPLAALEDKLGANVPQAANRWWQAQIGKVGKFWYYADALRTMVYKKSQRHFEKLMKEGLYDRKVAMQLAADLEGANVKPDLRKLRRIASEPYRLGLTYLREDEE